MMKSVRARQSRLGGPVCVIGLPFQLLSNGIVEIRLNRLTVGCRSRDRVLPFACQKGSFSQIETPIMLV